MGHCYGLPRSRGRRIRSVSLFWRDSSAVDRTRLLSEPAEPAAVEYEEYVPSPRIPHPETVVEYRRANQLFEVLDATSDYAGTYDGIASTTRGKAGGWPVWGSIDPFQVICECGATVIPLLQIGSGEWFSDIGQPHRQILV